MKDSRNRKQEIRQAVLDILFKTEPVTYDPSQYAHLKIGVAEVLARKEGRGGDRYGRDAELHEPDATILLEVFWDLVVERVITIGLNDTNPEFPWFRLHSEADLRRKSRKEK